MTPIIINFELKQLSAFRTLIHNEHMHVTILEISIVLDYQINKNLRNLIIFHIKHFNSFCQCNNSVQVVIL